MTFYVGQKVVCVNTSHGSPWVEPVLGAIYTVRNIVPWPNGRSYSIRLMEIHNALVGGFEPANPANWFRPVVERKTDISIFTKMLTPQKQRKRAFARN